MIHMSLNKDIMIDLFEQKMVKTNILHFMFNFIKQKHSEIYGEHEEEELHPFDSDLWLNN